jgi:enoyl-CoA hydratase
MTGFRVEKNNRIATISLDRPPVNALTIEMYEELTQVFETLGDSFEVNCALLTGAGTKAFCAGLDFHAFLSATPEDDVKRMPIVRRAYAAVHRCSIPVIAVVNGPALGAGAVLASLCDIRIASEGATFGLPEINVGRCGGAAHVGRLIFQGALRRMAFTGKPISAAEAYRIGLIDQLVAADQLLPVAGELAAQIASKSPLGLRYGKKALNGAEYISFEDGYALEQTYTAELLQTEDAQEAKRAVIEKRAPVFVGR